MEVTFHVPVSSSFDLAALSPIQRLNLRLQNRTRVALSFPVGQKYTQHDRLIKDKPVELDEGHRKKDAGKIQKIAPDDSICKNSLIWERKKIMLRW